tara:strand:+ start:3048 stop:4181 length:1134 start_codon:yes stop_codon:yes gene_type:complete
MAFLKNSDDIIIDAILTNLGHIRKVDLTPMKITKFALFDDEIDYSLYRGPTHAGGPHPSGSAYNDLDILQRPVLEAFSRSRSQLKSNLVTLNGRPEFLPVLKLNFNRLDYTDEKYNSSPTWGNSVNDGWEKECFLVLYDEATIKKLDGTNLDNGMPNSFNVIGPTSPGARNYLNQFQPDSDAGGIICIDHGVDAGPPNYPTIDPFDVEEYLGGDFSLYEFEYFVEFDFRFCMVADMSGQTYGHPGKGRGRTGKVALSFQMSDFTTGIYNSDTFTEIQPTEVYPKQTPIQGPRSTRLQFKLMEPPESYDNTIISNSKIFDELGVKLTPETSIKMFNKDVTGDLNAEYTFRYIDSEIKVYTGTTGYEIAIPLRFMKLIT